MSEADVKFYMQACTKEGVLLDTKKDLENDFVGLRYIEAKGIENRGKVKNIYTETFADADALRVWHPSEQEDGKVMHEATTVQLDLLFYGVNRRLVFEQFNEYIYGGYRVFWDTLRNKKFTFVVIESTEPSEDIVKGGVPYIRCSWKLQNLKGKTDKV